MQQFPIETLAWGNRWAGGAVQDVNRVCDGVWKESSTSTARPQIGTCDLHDGLGGTFSYSVERVDVWGYTCIHDFTYGGVLLSCFQVRS